MRLHLCEFFDHFLVALACANSEVFGIPGKQKHLEEGLNTVPVSFMQCSSCIILQPAKICY